MTGHFQSRYAIGDPVRALGLPAKIVAITFRAEGTTYEVAYESGGANSQIDSTEIGDV